MFVTRFSENAALKEAQDMPIPEAATGIILQDRIVRLSSISIGWKTYYQFITLRCISIARKRQATPVVLQPMDLTCSLGNASVIKRRWDIELFFKWIKHT